VTCSRGHRKSKKLPYGAKKGRYWCDGCDAQLVPSNPSKRRERQKAKKEIKNGLQKSFRSRP
jgi:hypothetical protein